MKLMVFNEADGYSEDGFEVNGVSEGGLTTCFIATESML